MIQLNLLEFNSTKLFILYFYEKFFSIMSAVDIVKCFATVSALDTVNIVWANKPFTFILFMFFVINSYRLPCKVSTLSTPGILQP